MNSSRTKTIFTIGLITSSRADWGIWLPILQALKTENNTDIQIICTGSHTFEHSQSLTEIQESGYEIAFKVPIPEPGENTEGLKKSFEAGVSAFVNFFTVWKPDALLVLGDRYEMCAATIAASSFKIPIVHFHGGETTEGALDDVFRTQITECADLHFVAAEPFRQKVILSGKKTDTVITSGAPGLDRFRNLKLPERNQVLAEIGFKPDDEFFLLTFHPVTRLNDLGAKERNMLIEAFRVSGEKVLITLGSGDPAYRSFAETFRKFSLENPDQVKLIESAGEALYPALMKYAIAVIGNSSSGLIEAPYFGVPVINVGIRQKGRLSTEHTLHVPAKKTDILNAIKKVKDPDYAAIVKKDINPYGDGFAMQKIMPVFMEWLGALKTNS